MTLNITGERYGRLVAVERVGSKRRQAVWRFSCDCGGERIGVIGEVRSGRCQSCGCIAREVSTKRLFKHGHKVGKTPTATYNRWVGMVQRCTDPNLAAYKHYGGRGIYVCDRWKNDFAAFYADMGDAPVGMSLDRIDVNGPYSPENCRWATPAQQSNNRRNTILVQYCGEQRTLSDVARETGVSYASLWRRYKSGTGVEETVRILRTTRGLPPLEQQRRE